MHHLNMYNEIGTILIHSVTFSGFQSIVLASLASNTTSPSSYFLTQEWQTKGVAIVWQTRWSLAI